MSSIIIFLLSISRAPVGSSANKIFVFPIKALAIATL
jgi:hypothetical protein